MFNFLCSLETIEHHVFVAEAYVSKISLRPLGGVKFDLFLTRDTSLFSSPSKYSHNLIFLINAFTSSSSLQELFFYGVGVNLRLIIRTLFSILIRLRFDKLNIFVNV